MEEKRGVKSQRFVIKHIGKSLQPTAKPKLAKELACLFALKGRGNSYQQRLKR